MDESSVLPPEKGVCSTRAAAPQPAPHADGDSWPGKVPSLGMAQRLGISPPSQSLKHIVKCQLIVTAIFFRFKALPGDCTLRNAGTRL